MDEVRKNGVRLLPVDSEHSAIFQSLEGNRNRKIRKILLTASGGPFRGMKYNELETVTPEAALKHPNWSMGPKITIDSATMMNKGLEVIEAKWLFGVDTDDIKVLIHPQSIIHSAVEFEDKAVIAEMGTPDMRIPINFALGYPERLPLDLPGIDFFRPPANNLTFEEPDRETFRCLELAVEASRRGRGQPVVMNAANEILVEAFINRRIGFNDIPRGVEKMTGMIPLTCGEPDIDEIVELDRETRIRTEEEISCLH